MFLIRFKHQAIENQSVEKPQVWLYNKYYHQIQADKKQDASTVIFSKINVLTHNLRLLDSIYKINDSNYKSKYFKSQFNDYG